MSAPIALTITTICMHGFQRKTPVPGGRANSTGHRGLLKSVSLKLNADHSTSQKNLENIFWLVNFSHSL